LAEWDKRLIQKHLLVADLQWMVNEYFELVLEKYDELAD